MTEPQQDVVVLEWWMDRAWPTRLVVTRIGAIEARWKSYSSGEWVRDPKGKSVRHIPLFRRPR